MSIASYIQIIAILIYRFVNMIYDFKFSAGSLSMCMLDDLVNNPAPAVGCKAYRGATAFCALSWYYHDSHSLMFRFLWTFSMTYIISQIHKRVRKAQMQGYVHLPKGKEPGIHRPDLESRGTNRSPFNHIHGAPSDATTGTYPSSPTEAVFGGRSSR